MHCDLRGAVLWRSAEHGHRYMVQGGAAWFDWAHLEHEENPAKLDSEGDLRACVTEVDHSQFVILRPVSGVDAVAIFIPYSGLQAPRLCKKQLVQNSFEGRIQARDCDG